MPVGTVQSTTNPPTPRTGADLYPAGLLSAVALALGSLLISPGVAVRRRGNA